MPTQLIWSFPDDSNNNVMGMKGSDSYFVIAETLRHILWQCTDTWMTSIILFQVAKNNNPDGLHYKLNSCSEMEICNLSIVLMRGVNYLSLR